MTDSEWQPPVNWRCGYTRHRRLLDGGFAVDYCAKPHGHDGEHSAWVPSMTATWPVVQPISTAPFGTVRYT